MFKKGERIWLAGEWNRKGVWFVREVIVDACGKKRMVLTDANTGEYLGSQYRPEYKQGGYVGGAASDIAFRADDLTAALAEALVAAEAWRLANVEATERQIRIREERGEGNDDFTARRRRDLEALRAQQVSAAPRAELLAATLEEAR